jgi:putative ABC transport system substrate-binding protein
MRRRNFIALFGGAIAWPLAARAQQTGKVSHIGLLINGPPGPDPMTDAFYQGLREHGYIEGQNIVVERVDAEFKPERFAQLAAELVRRKVDVIVVFSTSPARAVKEATNTIPIVVIAMADPVLDGLVASLARPGGNLTGNTFIGPELIAKRFGLLKEAIPGLSRVAALWHPTAYGEGTMAHMVKET